MKFQLFAEWRFKPFSYPSTIVRVNYLRQGGVFCTATKFVPNNCEVRNTANGRSDCQTSSGGINPSISSYSDVKIGLSISSKDSIPGWKVPSAIRRQDQEGQTMQSNVGIRDVLDLNIILYQKVRHPQFNTHLRIASFLDSKSNFLKHFSLHCLWTGTVGASEEHLNTACVQSRVSSHNTKVKCHISSLAWRASS